MTELAPWRTNVRVTFDPRAPSAGASGAARTAVSRGGVLAALAASSCCVLPFALFTLGIGGAWIGNLTALAPYQPYFVALALAFLAGGLVLVHREPAAACGEGSYCARPASDRVAKAGLWTSAALISLALARPYAAPLLFDL
jgi:mercuric ion transport protein